MQQQILPTTMPVMRFNWQPVLEDGLVVLRPLREDDFEELFTVAQDPLIWQQHPNKNRCQREGFEPFFKEAMASRGAFAIVDKATGSIIGTTRFTPIAESANAIAIGFTFLSRSYWGGQYNKHVKSLMMAYAFGLVDNVLYYIHEHNLRSQKAVEKLGGKRITHLEGIPLAPRPNASVIYHIGKYQWG